MDQKSEEMKISFQPLSEGLGFHPFSDGLPYAPVAKSAKNPEKNSAGSLAPSQRTTVNAGLQMGTGAVAAGVPQPVLASHGKSQRSFHVPQISVPVARQASVAEKSMVKTEPSSSQFFTWGYLMRRVLGQGMDVLLSATLFLLAARFWFRNDEFNSELFMNLGVIVVTVGFWSIFHWSTLVIQEIIFKTTLGKRMLGLRLHGNAFLILIRSILFIPSFGLFGLGLLWGVFDPKKRCWHDRIVGIQPLHYRF